MRTLILTVLTLVFVSFALLLGAPAVQAGSLHPSSDVEVLHPGEGQTAMLGDIPVLFKTIAEPGQSSQVSITESTIQPQEGAPLYKHAPETFYVIDGEFEFYAGQPDGTIKTLKANTGDLINVPAGIPHAPKNIGKTSGRLLTITGSDWFQNFLDDVTSQVSGDTSAYGVPSVEKMTPIAKKYGIEFVELPGKESGVGGEG